MVDTQSLKNKIFDLAIKGKLVLQDDKDEPASVVLKRISDKKKRLLEEGKLKKKDLSNDSIIFKDKDNKYYEKLESGSVKCIEDEIPYEIPSNWSWCRLGFLAYYKKGPFGSDITKSMFIPESQDAIKVYEQTNAINKDATIGDYYISQDKYEELKSNEVFPNDIIVSCAGTIGETFVMPSTMRKGIINQALMKISLYDLDLIDFYLMYFDFKLKALAREEGFGVALKNIPPLDVLRRFLVPIPPIEEQQRIMTNLTLLTDVIDGIESAYKELNHEVEALRIKVIGQAIKGELVSQDNNDEPASLLLEHISDEKEKLINQGKLKCSKNQSVIYKGDDGLHYEKLQNGNERCIEKEIPFEIPDNWCWKRLPDICSSIFAGGDKPDDFSDVYDLNHPYPIFSNGKEKLGLYGYTSEPKVNVPAVTISARGTIGFCCVRREPFTPIIRLLTIVPYDMIDIDYLYYVLENKKIGGLGSSIPQLTVPGLKSLLVPIPPLTEQKRIVEKVELLIENIGLIKDNLQEEQSI